jgi:hypothetical protein
MAIDGERTRLAVGTKVIVRKNGAKGVVTAVASNGKWPNIFEHEVTYGIFNRVRWCEPYDLLVLDDALAVNDHTKDGLPGESRPPVKGERE